MVAFITLLSDGIFQHASPAAMRGNVGDYRLEIEITVGDVEKDDAVALDRPAVDGERFAREKMYRHRVGRKGIDRQQVDRVVRPAGQAQPRVAEHDPDLRRALVEEGEAVAGDVDHRRIDLEEGPALVGAGITGQRAAAEPDHGDPRMGPVQCLGVGKSETDAGAAGI